MKVLHTSDWHLGHKLYEHDRYDEHAHMLKQIASIAQQEQADVLVVSGDIYHTGNPSKQTQKLFHDMLIEIQDAAPHMQIVVSSGNHDSSLGIEIARSLWERCGIHVVGLFERHDEELVLERHIVEICHEGKRVGYVVAIPFAHPANFPKVQDNASEGDERQTAFVQAVLDLVRERNTDNLPVVLMAHLFVQGSEPNQHDNIGGLEYVQIEDFGTNYDYLALGHIHKPRNIEVKGELRARYCGSPLAVSFDESFKHSVSVIEFEDRSPKLRTIELEPLRPLITYPQEDLPFNEALQALAEYAKTLTHTSYIRLKTSDYSAQLAPDSAERVSRVLDQTLGKYCLIKTAQPIIQEQGAHKSLTVQELKTANPMDIAQDYYRKRYNQDLPQGLAECLQKAIQDTLLNND